jgi:hypothetical protein
MRCERRSTSLTSKWLSEIRGFGRRSSSCSRVQSVDTTIRHKIRPLPHPDTFHLRGAEGWLDLGNPYEASQELWRIAPNQRGHPDVRYIRWEIYAKTANFQRCMTAARALIEAVPDDPRGWIALARTFYLTRQIARAYEVGLAKVEEFPGSWYLLYDTACYACLLGNRTMAEHYLDLAMAAGVASSIKRRALQDPDLAALWKPAT